MLTPRGSPRRSDPPTGSRPRCPAPRSTRGGARSPSRTSDARRIAGPPAAVPRGRPDSGDDETPCRLLMAERGHRPQPASSLRAAPHHANSGGSIPCSFWWRESDYAILCRARFAFLDNRNDPMLASGPLSPRKSGGSTLCSGRSWAPPSSCAPRQALGQPESTRPDESMRHEHDHRRQAPLVGGRDQPVARGYAWLAGGTWLFSEPQVETDTLIDLGSLDWPSLRA